MVVVSSNTAIRNQTLLLMYLLYVMLYLLTAVGLTPGGSSTVYIYTQTIYRTAQNKQYIEQHNNFGRVHAVPRHGEFYRAFTLQLRKKHGKTSVNFFFSKYLFFLILSFYPHHTFRKPIINHGQLVGVKTYRVADKSLARPTSRFILFDGENISFDASLVIYIYIYIYI